MTARNTIRAAALTNGWTVDETCPLIARYTRANRVISVRFTPRGDVQIAGKRAATDRFNDPIPGRDKRGQILALLAA